MSPNCWQQRFILNRGDDDEGCLSLILFILSFQTCMFNPSSSEAGCLVKYEFLKLIN